MTFVAVLVAIATAYLFVQLLLEPDGSGVSMEPSGSEPSRSDDEATDRMCGSSVGCSGDAAECRGGAPLSLCSGSVVVYWSEVPDCGYLQPGCGQHSHGDCDPLDRLQRDDVSCPYCDDDFCVGGCV